MTRSLPLPLKSICTSGGEGVKAMGDCLKSQVEYASDELGATAPVNLVARCGIQRSECMGEVEAAFGTDGPGSAVEMFARDGLGWFAFN